MGGRDSDETKSGVEPIDLKEGLRERFGAW
jgi:hypothetical protein